MRQVKRRRDSPAAVPDGWLRLVPARTLPDKRRGRVMTDRPWERARLIPVSGISGADEQERRGASALLAVVNSVREFGRAITAPLGAPAGTPMAFIEVSFTSGEKKLRPDGVLQVKRGSVP